MLARNLWFAVLAFCTAPVWAQTTSAPTPASASVTAPATQVGASKDLRELAGRLSPAILQSNEIVRNPYRVVIVLNALTNKTEDMPGRDLIIYLAKLTSVLNTSATADRLLFVEQNAAMPRMAAQETVGGPGAAQGPAAAIKPQFALAGTLFSIKNGDTVHYLVQFHLTNLTTGAQAWSGEFEVQTLN